MPEPATLQELPQIAFMVGLGRSGTTLLTNMLNMHPEIVATPENEFILFSYSSFASKKFHDPQVVRAFIRMFDYNYNNVINIWKPSEDFAEGIAQLKSKDYASVCRLAYLYYPLSQKERSKVKWVVDKNPSYSLHMDMLHRLYPEAKYIVIVRDYRDNVISRRNHSDKPVSLLSLAAAWSFFYEKIFRFAKAFGLPLHILRYEDLAQNPEATLRSLCDYLGVAYDERMLKFQDFFRQVKDHARVAVSEDKFKKISTMHANLNREVNADRVDAFLQELSEAEIAQLDMACHTYGKRFNYKPVANTTYQVSFADKLRYRYAYCRVMLFNTIRDLYYRTPMSLRLRFKKERLWNNS